jgi:hypothetical protein
LEALMLKRLALGLIVILSLSPAHGQSFEGSTLFRTLAAAGVERLEVHGSADPFVYGRLRDKELHEVLEMVERIVNDPGNTLVEGGRYTLIIESSTDTVRAFRDAGRVSVRVVSRRDGVRAIRVASGGLQPGTDQTPQNGCVYSSRGAISTYTCYSGGGKSYESTCVTSLVNGEYRVTCSANP